MHSLSANQFSPPCPVLFSWGGWEGGGGGMEVVVVVRVLISSMTQTFKSTCKWGEEEGRGKGGGDTGIVSLVNLLTLMHDKSWSLCRAKSSRRHIS